MDVVIGSVASDSKPNRRDIQASRMVRVGVAELHDEQFVPFQIDYISLESLGHH